MNLHYTPYLLEFKHPFGVSSNTRTHTPTVYVRLELDGVYGYGEACLPKYLGESTEDTLAFLKQAKVLFEKATKLEQIQEMKDELDRIFPANNAGKAALDTSFWDLKGKLLNKPLYSLFGIQKSDEIVTSHTIGIDEEKKIEEKVKEAEEFRILKIKIGTKDDKELIRTLKKFTDKPLYVDVNQGWTDLGFAIEMSHFLSENNVVLIEQPMPVNRIEEMVLLTEKSPIPTIADENVKRLSDIANLKGVFSGINIKLMKCGGVTEAFKMIESAKKNKMKVMLGCMAESSCATAAMVHFAGMADYVDLDAPCLIKNDPFEGINYMNGRITPLDSPGIGIRLRSIDSLFE